MAVIYAVSGETCLGDLAGTTAVRNPMLPIDTVTYFSEAASDIVSELRVIVVTICDLVVILVRSVKSDKGQTSYPVSLNGKSVVCLIQRVGLWKCIWYQSKHLKSGSWWCILFKSAY